VAAGEDQPERVDGLVPVSGRLDEQRQLAPQRRLAPQPVERDCGAPSS
jgi:hypothetical protein